MMTNKFDVTYNPSSYKWENAVGVVADATGIYYSGFSRPSGYELWIVIKIDKDTGATLWTQILDIGTSLIPANDAIVIDSTGIYIGGTRNGNSNLRIEKRDLSTGAIIWSFEYLTVGFRVLAALAIDSTGVFTVIDENAGTWKRHIEKRDLTTGAILSDQIWPVGVIGGKYTARLAVDSTNYYLTRVGVASGEGIVESRDKSTLVLQWSTTIKEGANFTYIDAGLAIDTSNVYIGGYTSGLPTDWGFVVKVDISTGAIIWQNPIQPGVDSDIKDISIGNNSIYVTGVIKTILYEFYMIEMDMSTGSIVSEIKEPIRASWGTVIFYDSLSIYVGGFIEIAAEGGWLFLGYTVSPVLPAYITLGSIPISSFQGNLNSSGEDFLSANIPDGISAISAYSDLVGKFILIKKKGKNNLGVEVEIEIIRAQIRYIRQLRTPNSELVTLYAYITVVPNTNPIGYKLINITNTSDYKGKKSIKGISNKPLKVGDTVETYNVSPFVIGQINFVVSGNENSITITEE